MNGERLRAANGALTEVVEGKAFVVRPDGSEVLTLNRTGTALWEALAAGATEGELVAVLARRFPAVPSDRLAQDVRAFLAELRSASLIEEA